MLSDGKKQQQYKRGCRRGHHQKPLKRRLFPLFLDNLEVILAFLTLQGKHNTRTLSDIRKFCFRNVHRLTFLPVSKARTHKSYMYVHCLYTLK